jgi:hypothetical protein
MTDTPTDSDLKQSEINKVPTNSEFVQPDESTSSPDSDLIPPGCGLYLAWFMLTILGSILGWMLGWQTSYLVPGKLSIFALAGVMGLILGAAQWLVLRSHFTAAWWWILATVLGWTAGFPLGAELASRLGLVGFLFGMLVGLTTGAALGLLQWLVLRQHVTRAFWWIPTSIFAWISALIYYQPASNWLGLMFGLLVGIVTGLVLLWLLYRPTET